MDHLLGLFLIQYQNPLPGCSNGPGGSCPLSQYNNYINRRHIL
jgi:hypothetical protein